MENKYHCPQCGATSSVKISANEFHCAFCNSSFEVESTSNSGKNQSKIIVIIVLVLSVISFLLSVFFTNHTNKRTHSGRTNLDWSDRELKHFEVFVGSKGSVVWAIKETHCRNTDSARFILEITSIENKKLISEKDFLPPIKYSESIMLNNYDGYWQFGDTCWISSRDNGLIGRDIYTGSVIADTKSICKNKLKDGITIAKSEFSFSTNTFELTSSDGLKYYFYPTKNILYSVEEFGKIEKTNIETRTFFVFSEGDRPHLFKSIEQTNSLARKSDVSTYLLSDYNEKRKDWGSFGAIIKSVKPVNPDKIYYNGTVAWSDDNKAILLYQNGLGKNFSVNVVCMDTCGKTLWNIDTKNSFSEEFSTSKSLVYFSSNKYSLAIFSTNRKTGTNAIGINISDGKILWEYPFKK